jgi:hypothetical protein
MAKHVRLGNLKRARLLVMATVVLAGLSITGLALASQGDPDKVLTVDNPNVSCASPVAGPKVEGQLGTTISFSAAAPIDFVTVKSGQGAVVVSAQFDTTTGQITLSKDVSNYVVWTCPPATTTTGATTTSGATTTTVKPTTTTGATTTSGATTTTVKPTTTTGATSTSVVGGVSSTRPGGGGALPFTGAASLPMLFGALALLGLGTASVLAGRRRRRA